MLESYAGRVAAGRPEYEEESTIVGSGKPAWFKTVQAWVRALTVPEATSTTSLNRRRPPSMPLAEPVTARPTR